MSNAAKHSRGSRINVTLHQSAETLDPDGYGRRCWINSATVDSQSHFGLSLIAERVKAAAGTVEVRTSLGSGTVVHALIS